MKWLVEDKHIVVAFVQNGATNLIMAVLREWKKMVDLDFEGQLKSLDIDSICFPIMRGVIENFDLHI